MLISIIQTFIIIAANVVVGIILRKQIKSQKETIEAYKGLVEATDPSKIIILHDREIQKLKDTMGQDLADLQTQLVEMGSFVDNTLNNLDDMAKSLKGQVDWSRSAIININMPHCVRILAKIHDSRENLTS